MKITYTVNGQEGTYSVSGQDRYKLERLMNDGIGIPPEPMTDVLVFAAYMGEYSLYGFYQEIVKEFLNPDELFNSEPIEYFNTVLSPLFEDEVIHILDITEWDMLENKKGVKRVKEGSKRQYRDPMRKVRALREEEEAESEEGNVTFTPDELKFIAGRMFVESEWGASVYDGGSLEIIKSILTKMDEAGIEYK